MKDFKKNEEQLVDKNNVLSNYGVFLFKKFLQVQAFNNLCPKVEEIIHIWVCCH